jgi:predicted MFS family arabinose efflux permease
MMNTFFPPGPEFVTAATRQRSTREVLHIPAVRRLWAAQIVSIFGDFLALFAVFAIVTFQLHGSPTQVSMILVAYLLPFAVISPVAGVFVDKWDVKLTMVGSDLIRGVLVLALLFVRDLPLIYASFFALSAVSSFFVPAQSVAIRALAPPAGLLAVNALMTQAMQGSQIISPAVAGLLVEGLGANSCFLLDSLSFFVSAGLVMSLRIERSGPVAPRTDSILSSLRQGVRFIFGKSTIAFVFVAMASGTFAVRCFGGLLSVYVRDILRSTPAMFGTLNSMIGVGMIVGTQSLHRFGARIAKPRLVVRGLTGMGAAVLLTAWFGAIPSTALGMLGLGVSLAYIMTPSQTLLQQETPAEMLGRVSSSLISLMAMSQVVAMFLAGPVAQQVGIRNLYLGSAAMLLALGIAGSARLREWKIA